ncbi:MAG: hypothetical protein WCK35_21780, partial [Chloroflexota bacterium]
MKLKMFRQFILTTIILCGLFALTGCFKSEISVDVNENGSGLVSIAYGVTQQAKTLLAAQSKNPMSEIINGFGLPYSDGNNLTVTNWVDGDYEWTKASKEFASLEEINAVLSANKLFNSFSITRMRGLLQDEFVLQAELAPISETAGSSLVDPSGFVQIRFSIKLPGEIKTTNGAMDGNNPDHTIWTVQSNSPTSLNLRSASWNWLNIGLGAGFGLLLFLIFVVALVFSLSGPKARPVRQPVKKSTPLVQKPVAVVAVPVPASLEDSHPVLSPLEVLHTAPVESPVPAVYNPFEELGVETLLSQVNDKILKGAGKFHRSPDEVILFWTDETGQYKFIGIKYLGLAKFSVNGQLLPATRDDIKAGIL